MKGNDLRIADNVVYDGEVIVGEILGGNCCAACRAKSEEISYFVPSRALLERSVEEQKRVDKFVRQLFKH